MTDQLFDPNDYKSRADRSGGRRQPTSRVITRQARLEPIEPGWSMITTARGVSAHQHAVKTVMTHSSVRTHCGMLGRELNVDFGHVAERCAVCEDQASIG